MERIAVSVDKRTNHNQTTTTNTNNSRHWYLNITTSYVGNLLTWNTYRPFVFDTDESNILSVSLEQPPLEDKTIEENNNNVKNVSSITTTTVYRNLKHCPCAQPLLNEGIPNVEYYWETSTYCHVYNSQSGEGGVNCIKYKNWTVSYVRSSWYYICFVVVLLVLFLLCSKTGHVSTLFVAELLLLSFVIVIVLFQHNILLLFTHNITLLSYVAISLLIHHLSSNTK